MKERTIRLYLQGIPKRKEKEMRVPEELSELKGAHAVLENLQREFFNLSIRAGSEKARDTARRVEMMLRATGMICEKGPEDATAYQYIANKVAFAVRPYGLTVQR